MRRSLGAFGRSFGFSLVLSGLGVGYVLGFLGIEAAIITLVLVAVEIAFSFDNAVINAKILVRLSPFWQKMFLSVGIIIAVFGMRAIFPIAMVSLTAHLPWREVVDLALNNPAVYAEKLALAHPSITSFGGGFLMMLGLNFFMEKRSVYWIDVIERPLGRIGRWWLPPIVATIMLAILAFLPMNHHSQITLQAGIAGIITYLMIHGLILLADRTLGKNGSTAPRVGMAAFATFIYLELLDASFSFDGVIGAFAITDKVLLIAIGLGIGALWVRSLTVYMVRSRALDDYKYLEHGAHYAVMALALVMLVGVIIDVPEIITGSLGLGFIGASLVSSKQALKTRMKVQ